MAAHTENGNLYGPGITRIAVSGFKSLAEKTDVAIRPLTVLAGANSSGKSSLMQPLLLMKQTLESDVNPAGPFRLSGPYTDYTESKQFLSSIDPADGSCQRLVVDFEMGGQKTAGFTYSIDANGSLMIDETRGSRFGVNTPSSWTIRHDSSAAEIRALDFPWDFSGSTKGLFDYHAERYRFYLRIKASKSSDASDSWSQSHEFLETMFLNNEIRRLILVPGLRGDQLRKWYLTDVPATNIFEGPFESYVPCLIDFWQQSISRGPINELNTALRFLELASSVGTRRLNESQIEMRVPRTFTSDGNDFVNVADVGLAVSAALPVLVALINAAPGQLVYIEHPELHLHPRAQWRMAQLLAQAAKRDIRLVIETHSSLLLQGILTCVAKDEIAKDKVALHWFSRDERGVTRVKMADLDERGRIGDWPSDFDDVEMRASNEYLDAIEKKLYANVK
jgi:hypothetical protein